MEFVKADVFFEKREHVDGAPLLAYAPEYGYRIVHWECGKGLCDDHGNSVGAWFKPTDLLKIKHPFKCEEK